MPRNSPTTSEITNFIADYLRRQKLPEPTKVFSDGSADVVRMQWSPNDFWWPEGEVVLVCASKQVSWAYVPPGLPICFQKIYDSQPYDAVFENFQVPPVVADYIQSIPERLKKCRD